MFLCSGDRRHSAATIDDRGLSAFRRSKYSLTETDALSFHIIYPANCNLPCSLARWGTTRHFFNGWSITCNRASPANADTRNLAEELVRLNSNAAILEPADFRFYEYQPTGTKIYAEARRRHLFFATAKRSRRFSSPGGSLRWHTCRLYPLYGGAEFRKWGRRAGPGNKTLQLTRIRTAKCARRSTTRPQRRQNRLGRPQRRRASPPQRNAHHHREGG